jgi:hypothetical protein
LVHSQGEIASGEVASVGLPCTRGEFGGLLCICLFVHGVAEQPDQLILSKNTILFLFYSFFLSFFLSFYFLERTIVASHVGASPHPSHLRGARQADLGKGC